MARASASISQPGIKARRTIFGVKAEIGGTVAKARMDLTVQLRAELRNGRLSAGIIEKVNAKFSPTALKAKSSKLSSGAKVNKSIPLVSEYGVGFSPSPFIIATGGTVSYDGNYKIHTFTSDGIFEITYLSTASQLEYLIVGGGGAGGDGAAGGSGGGGGAGGYLAGTLNFDDLGVGEFPIIIGGVSSGTGNNSSAFSLIAYGGGKGALYNYTGYPGGEDSIASGGGGAGRQVSAGGYGGIGGIQGYDGGRGARHTSNGSYRSGGGGGGAGGDGAAGVDSYTGGGAGGSGISNSISGVSVTYAKGGKGGHRDSLLLDGAINTGNGGSGGSVSTNLRPAGKGGSGIIIIRYLYQ